MRDSFCTLIEVLRRRAAQQPQQTATVFLIDGEQNAVSWTYAELDEHARAIAAALGEMNAAGERVLIVNPPGLEFIAALFGCLYAGAVAVPTFPPQFNRPGRSAVRLSNLVRDAQPTVALTTEANLARAMWFSHGEAELRSLKWLATDAVKLNAAASWSEPPVNGDSLAVLQYTSGSTGSPRGVMLSHGNLLDNLRLIRDKFGYSESSLVVSWLPPYHDMGLIGNIFEPMLVGFPEVHMEPLHFLQRPRRWLEAVSRYRATTSGGPNFAYDLCVRAVGPDDRAGLDLSSWTVAFSGAEPIRAKTIERFTQAFGDCGFRPETFYPCYGLAEATLCATGGEPTERPRIRVFDRKELERNRVLLVEDKPDAQAKIFDGPASLALQASLIRSENDAALVSCGTAYDDHRVVIVDPETNQPCDAGRIGEVWIASRSVAQGYWNKPQETKATFQNHLTLDSRPFLRTGDLGFLLDGELFVTGRIKDLLIVRGRSYYPQDLEALADVSHPALLGLSAAFPVELDGSEQIVVACEVRRELRRSLDIPEVVRSIRAAIVQEFELSVYAVVLLKPGSIPRTTSGKIQRTACRLAFQDKSWEPIAEDCIEPFAELDDVAGELIHANASDRRQSHLDRAALEAPGADRVRLLREYLTARLTTMLRSPGHWLDEDRPLSHLGVDSLMRVELLLRVEADLDVTLGPDAIEPDMSLGGLLELIEQRLAEPVAHPGSRGGHYIEARRASEGREDPLASASGLCETTTDSPFIPLTPTQHEFLNGVDHPEKFSTVLFLRTPADLDAAALESALRSLEQQHDALRLRFQHDGQAWRQQYDGVGAAVAFQRFDVTALGPEELKTLRSRVTTELPGALDVARGPLVQAAWLDRGPRESGLLVLCLHHLVIDGPSVAIFVSGLERAYRRCRRGESPAWRAPPVTFGQWANWLDDYAQSESVRGDLPYWVDTCRRPEPVHRKTSDRANNDSISAPSSNGGATSPSASSERRSWQTRGGRLNPAEHRRFLNRFPTAQAQHDVFLSALARAWMNHTGQDELFVMLENHGRHPLRGRTPSTTIGWFVSRFPLFLRVEPSADDQTTLELVGRAVAAVPHRGQSFGLLAHQCRDPQTRRTLDELPHPPLGMTYYGHLHDVFREDAVFPVLREYTYDRSRQTRRDRSSDLCLAAHQERGTTRWDLMFNTAVHSSQAISALSDAVGSFVRNLC